ncbi:hypothetical protein K466DRAFT_594968 [Polyporus arcularius HHB13444]|uniref:Uncharacterized protein n=1 Tax=Polyporus arcularius HHB13444 TaxID=1314778 RepID=A0A5C3PSF1_9APHY|nr:hypothetical protein K466DRAFT_594968 [Polyporus arcularius HHB13444]
MLSARRITSDEVEQKDIYSVFIGGFGEVASGPMTAKDCMGKEVEVMELVVYRRSERPLVQIPVCEDPPTQPPSPREPGAVFDEDVESDNGEASDEDDGSDNGEVFDEDDDSYYAELDIGESDEDGIAPQVHGLAAKDAAIGQVTGAEDEKMLVFNMLNCEISDGGRHRRGPGGSSLHPTNPDSADVRG